MIHSVGWIIVIRKHILILAIVVLSSLLLCAGLDNRYLWQDEAQTALVSLSINKGGIPRGTDGRNFFSQELGAEYGNNHVWKWHTWLPFYVLAGFFSVFGKSTLVARLPFVLCGLGSVVLVWLFSLQIFRKKGAALISALLLGTSVPFLLIARQSRNYSMLALLILAVLLFYRRLLSGRRGGFWGMVVSATLLFHTHYLYCAGTFLAIVIHTFLFHRDKSRKIITGAVVTGSINSPWVVWLSGMKYGERYGDTLLDISRPVSLLFSYILEIHTHVMPLYLLIFIPLVMLVQKKRPGTGKGFSTATKESLALVLLVLATHLLLLAVVSPAPFFRYISPLMPLLTISITALIVQVGSIHRILLPIIVLALILQGDLKGYIHDITHEFNGPIRGIVTYLKANGSPDDTVAITYGDMPLKFYTGMRVVGGLTGEDLTPAKKADWVIIRHNSICEKDLAVRKYLVEHLDPANYRRVVLNVPDVPFENREDPAAHIFTVPPTTPPVILYEKK